MFFRLFPDFKFSLRITVVCILLATLMLWASSWQWQRYHEKLALIETYKEHDTAEALTLPEEIISLDNVRDLLDRKVQVTGTFDYEHQMIVANRHHFNEAGYWLLTPLRLENSDKAIIVSRGFIPFEESSAKDWGKYNFENLGAVEGVLKKSVAPSTIFTPASDDLQSGSNWVSKWLYPDIEKIATQLPYPIITAVFLQKIGGPPTGKYPAESIPIDVPPSTHFGYAIEWILLALASLTVGFLLQAFPRRKQIYKTSQTERSLQT